MIQHVPSEFQCRHPLRYPSDNYHEFERWFYDNFRPNKTLGRTYLPVFWTNYYCRNGYGKEIRSLQKFLDGLPRQPYFTIVQYDDGILNDLTALDIRTYSMSGRPMDYPLPLICQPHNAMPESQKRFLFSFVGRGTHPIRQEILRLRHVRAYMSTLPHNTKRFCEVLSQSVFTLCPRGYGPTSFRIMEALQMNSIPVYISDKFIIPHAVPFESYGVLIRPDQVKDIPRILEDTDPARKVNPYNTHFTYEANQKLIFDDLINSYKNGQ